VIEEFAARFHRGENRQANRSATEPNEIFLTKVLENS
jgi:hypothetical protein